MRFDGAADFNARGRFNFHVVTRDFQEADKLLAGNPPVAAMGGPDQWTIRLDVRELNDLDVQRVADAVYAILMPASVRR